MELAYCLPTPGFTVQFVRAKSLSKKDWLMCPACSLPQMFCQGCCFDPECEPHMFRVDTCVHCGFDLRANDDPKGYDVEKGKAKRRHPSWRRTQKRVIAEYDRYCREPRYPDTDGT